MKIYTVITLGVAMVSMATAGTFSVVGSNITHANSWPFWTTSVGTFSTALISTGGSTAGSPTFDVSYQMDGVLELYQGDQVPINSFIAYLYRDNIEITYSVAWTAEDEDEFLTGPPSVVATVQSEYGAEIRGYSNGSSSIAAETGAGRRFDPAVAGPYIYDTISLAPTASARIGLPSAFPADGIAYRPLTSPVTGWTMIGNAWYGTVTVPYDQNTPEFNLKSVLYGQGVEKGVSCRIDTLAIWGFRLTELRVGSTLVWSQPGF